MIIYQKVFSSYFGTEKKLHLKQPRGNDSESMKARVIVLKRYTLSRHALHNCKVS